MTVTRLGRQQSGKREIISAMLVLLCLSIGLVLGQALSPDTSATRLGKRALLHVHEHHRRLTVPVAPVSKKLARNMRLRILSGDREFVMPQSSLILVEDAHGAFMFAPPLPRGASSVRVELEDGSVLSETVASVSPDSWWPDLVARAVTVAECH